MAIKAGKYEVYITRNKINREGYTSGKYGQYYGATGQDVYSYETWPFEYSLAGEIRADSMKDAKERILGMAKFKNEIKAAEDPNYFKSSNPSSASTKSWVTINGVTYIIRSYSGGKLTATVGEKSRKVVATTSKYDSNGLYEKLRNLKKSNPSSLKVKSGEWIPCHAVRVRGEKLEIMKDALANTGKLTLAQAKLMAKQYGGSIKKVDGEYICRYKGQEYFTNDIHDAVGTIKLMSQGR